jgi:hypothetical protein
MLREWYALSDGETAFALVQRASQRFNVKVRTLADALLTTPGPDRPDGVWFPRPSATPSPRCPSRTRTARAPATAAASSEPY